MKMKNFCSLKNVIKKVKTTTYTWEQISANHMHLIREYIQNIDRTPTSLEKITNNPIFKNGKGLE